jgi:hypothetical protein
MCMNESNQKIPNKSEISCVRIKSWRKEYNYPGLQGNINRSGITQISSQITYQRNLSFSELEKAHPIP